MERVKKKKKMSDLYHYNYYYYITNREFGTNATPYILLYKYIPCNNEPTDKLVFKR